jgi:hypothetical protein
MTRSSKFRPWPRKLVFLERIPLLDENKRPLLDDRGQIIFSISTEECWEWLWWRWC